MKRTTWSAFVVAALVALPAAGQAQGIAITPSVGAYVPAGSFRELQNSVEHKREATLGLGLNIDFGSLRASLAYATGASISEDGVSGNSEIGEGSVLAVAGDLVLRPIPRILILQPYLLGGAGLKQQKFNYNDSGIGGAFQDEDDSDLTLHVGIGADIMIGRIGLIAEISDFISKNLDDKWKTHDAFALVGLKLQLF